MKRLRNNKGITLVALVVTIIVLLILAGVSLSGVFNQGGLFNRAEQASTEHRAGTVDDEVAMWKSEKQMAKYEQSVSASRDELIESQRTRGLLTDEEAETAKETGKVTIGTKTIDYGEKEITLVEMFKKAKADNCLDGKSCSNPGEHVHVGDYVVNYNNTLKNAGQSVTLEPSETGVNFKQTYKVDTATTWRVAGLSKDGTQLIITSGSPIKSIRSKAVAAKQTDEPKIEKLSNIKVAESGEIDIDVSVKNPPPYLHLKGAEAWYSTNDDLTNDNILDRVSRIYDSRYASKIGSMRIDDIETLLGIAVEKDGENSKVYKIGDSSKTSLGDDILWHFFGQSHTYQSGEYAPENYLKEKYPTNTRYNNITMKSKNDRVDDLGYGYTITNPNVVDQSSKIFEILFKDTTEISCSKGYWLASTGVLFLDDHCYFGPDVVSAGHAGCGAYYSFSSYGFATSLGFGVRPVVYLQSNVLKADLTISPNGEEEPWNFEIVDEGEEKIDAGQIGSN